MIDPHARQTCCATRTRVLAALLAGLAACADSAGIAAADGRLRYGTWGADNAAVIATDSVTHVHVGCTFGDMPGNVALAADGRFTLDGTYVLRAYPVAVGPSLPAQFSGQVTGGTLTLAIAVNDTVLHQVVALGPITVVLGRQPNMGPCPICAVPKRAMRAVPLPPGGPVQL